MSVQVVGRTRGGRRTGANHGAASIAAHAAGMEAPGAHVLPAPSDSLWFDGNVDIVADHTPLIVRGRDGGGDEI